MHVQALPYADQLRYHADEIELWAKSEAWEEYTPIHLEMSLVYSAVVIRKLWEHYKELFLEIGFDLNRPMPGLKEAGREQEQSGLNFVHRIIHSQHIDTSEESKRIGIEFQSDRGGLLCIGYDRVVEFLRQSASAAEDIHR